MKLPKNVTVYEGGRRHRGEIPDVRANAIAKTEEIESSKKTDGKKRSTLTGTIVKAQAILDNQKNKSAKSGAHVDTKIPENKGVGDNSLKNPEKK